MTRQGRGPLNDPRLTERRGDLSGINAAMFVLLVIAAFIAAAYLLATVLHIGASPASPSPSPQPSPSAVVRASASPAVSPSASAIPSAVPSPGVRVPSDVVVGGKVLGQVTLMEVQYPSTVPGGKLGSGLRWLATRIRYEASGNLPYDPKDWSVVNASGKRHPWAGVDLKPALGKGSLESGEKWGGNVTFKVPLQGTLWLVFSGGDQELRIQVPPT